MNPPLTPLRPPHYISGPNAAPPRPPTQVGVMPEGGRIVVGITGPEGAPNAEAEEELPPGQIPGEGSQVNDPSPPRRPRNPFAANEPVVGILYTPTERDTFERLILFPSVVSDIEDGLRQIQQREQLEQVWHISELQPVAGRLILSFYGPSGTGKTASARALAKQLGKPLYQVDYSEIISKYYGDTAKHIKLAFKQAKAAGAVLFFDEGDGLMSRRLDMSADGATTVNQNRNVLMQELDRFTDPVIVTTNLFGNYDPAFIRRIAKHIKFDLPNAQMRKQIFLKHIPNLDRVDADLDLVATNADGLAGGDIFTVCLNAILASSVDANPANWRVSQDTFLREVQRVKDARSTNATSRVSRNGQ